MIGTRRARTARTARRAAAALAAPLALSAALLAPPALAQDGPTVGMSWANFQEERWKIDEAGLEERLGELGGELVSTDAQSSSARQATDIESLISRGIDVLMIVAWDSEAILPSVQRAVDEGIPVIAYERQIEHPDVFYTAFNPVDVGRMQAEAIVEAAPEGRYAIIAGSPQDQYAHYVLEGQKTVLDPLVESGDIEIVAEQWTDAWLPGNAQANMEQILTAEGDEIDAVVAANDGTAGGVVAALASVGLDGVVPVSGQDGDIAALNRIALGTQTMTAWKDARELGRAAADVAAEIAGGAAFEEVTDVVTWDRGPKGVAQSAVVLPPVSVTDDNLERVVEAGWISEADLCAGVGGANAPAPCGG